MEILNDEDDNSMIEPSTFNDISEVLENYEELKKRNLSKPKLYKYERTKVIFERYQMIATGSDPFIKNPEKYDNIYDIVLEELQQKKILFIVKRSINGKYEYLKLEDFVIL